MMRVKNARFVTSAGVGSKLIDDGKVQIAIVGKSNVGKSSFINKLTNNGKLAKTGQQPGKTRLINYFAINNDSFYLVDLPGYGFAKAPKTEKEAWGALIEGYLSSGHVTHILLLLDSRHEPTQDDKQMYTWIQYYAVPHTLISTKADKLPKSKRKQAAITVAKQLGSISPALPFSAEDGTGLDGVLEQLGQIVNDVAWDE